MDNRKTMFETRRFYSPIIEKCMIDTGGTYRLICTTIVYDGDGKG